MIKYYVEFEHTADEESYCMQSDWFDTPEEATEWFVNSFDFIRTDDVVVSLMKGELDIMGNLIGDVEFVENITAKHYLKPHGKVKYNNLNLENAYGFVIDLSTPSTTYEALEAVLHSEEDREDLKKELTIYQIREFILEYYLSTYYDAYILMKKPNVYQIIEEELYTKSKQ